MVMVREDASCTSLWSWEEEKAFEIAIAANPEDCTKKWERIAAAVPRKSLEAIKRHYELLVEDIASIESGLVALPKYTSLSDGLAEHDGDAWDGSSKKVVHSNGSPGHSRKGSRLDHERKKGVAWTEDEHRLFLLGLDKHGKGDWRSISRNFVTSRTPTQVASHAQKFFIRLNSVNKDRKRTSIHDITSAGNGDMSVPQGPITGQINKLAMSYGNPFKKPSRPPPGLPIGIHGAFIGPPVGTPVSIPVPGTAHLAYSLRPSIAASICPGVPMNIPMPYLMQHAPVPR